MKALVLLGIAAALCLSACVTVDPVVARQNANLAAGPYIEASLTQPMPVLNEKAQTGDAHDALKLGLALLAERDNSASLTPEDINFLKDISQRIEEARQRWAWENPNSTVPFAWESHVQLTPAEQQNLAQVELKLTANPWILKAAMASITRQTAIYIPPVTMGGAGRVQLMPISSPVIPRLTMDAAIECVAGVREGVKAANARVYLLESIAGAKKTTAEEAAEIRALFALKPQIVSAQPAVCGSPEAFGRFGDLLKAAYEAEKTSAVMSGQP